MPLLLTLVLLYTSCRNFSTARPAFLSWKKPKIPVSNKTINMIMLSEYSPKIAESITAKTSNDTNGFLYGDKSKSISFTHGC
jgi:hypothetical protein